MNARCSTIVFGVAAAAVVLVVPIWPVVARSPQTREAGRLDIYFVDVEGGAATLIVTPTGESMLVDSGFPGNDDRDAKRIRKAAEIAGLKQIDQYLTTHWHRDHYGGIAALSQLIPIGQFLDRGIPASLAEDSNFPTQIADYRRVAGDRRREVKAGDRIELRQADAGPRLQLSVLAASGRVTKPPTAKCSEHPAKPLDPSDNAQSIALLLTFGDWQFLNCGDLTWNVEHDLVCPENSIGEVDVFMVTHHGSNTSNNPALVRAVNPRVAVMCNGPRKGGDIESIEAVRRGSQLVAFYQLHRNLRLSEKQNSPAEFVANWEEKCDGRFIKLSVSADASAYTVGIGPSAAPRKFQTK